MRVKTILNRVERHPGFVYGDALLDKDVRLLVPVTARKGSRPLCSGCGSRGPTYDTRPSREFRFVPLWGIAVFFVYAMRRVDCERCGVRVESVSWATGKEHSTTTLLWFLAMWAKRLSWQETAEAFDSSWRTVFLAVRMAVDWGRAHLVLGTIEGSPLFGVGKSAFVSGREALVEPAERPSAGSPGGGSHGNRVSYGVPACS